MSVCAILVTFQPELGDLEESLHALRPQVDAIVIVDNASRDELPESMRLLAKEYDCVFLQNESNEGVAAGLNRGVRFAAELGAGFVLLLDQDSTVNDGFVAAQMACLRKHGPTQRIGLVAPVVINRRSGLAWYPLAGPDGRPLLAQTSGSLMPLEVFEEAGYFEERLFIDYVDYEHCLRLRLAGWQIVVSREARLLHMPGVNSPVWRFGRQFYAINASPVRQYYRMRNLIWTVRHYWRHFPGTCSALLRSYVREYGKILLLEDRRWAKVKGSAAGLRDGLLDRMGVYEAGRMTQSRRIKYPLLRPRV